VVCPEADVKFFVDASPEVRAHRRMLELHAAGRQCSEADILTELLARDRADKTRKESPLIAATDAIHVDTTSLTVNEMVERAVAAVTAALA
jgi:cytidylate kinase